MSPTSPMTRAPPSPGNKAASPRPPLHPRTQLSGLDSPRAGSPSPRANLRPVSVAQGRLSARSATHLPSREIHRSHDSIDSRRRRSGSMMTEYSKIIPRIKLSSPSVLTTLWRTIGLCVFLAGAICVTGTTQTRMSLNWVYSSGSFPLLSCPSSTFLFGANEAVDGTFCKLLITAESPQVMSLVGPGVMLDGSYFFGHVVLPTPCESAPVLVNPRVCAMQSWSDTYPSMLSSCEYNVSPMCDADGTVSVGQIIALRGIVCASLFIVCIYAVVSCACVLKEQAELVPGRQRRLDLSRAVADASAREMVQLTSDLRFPSLVAETGHLRNNQATSTWNKKVLKAVGPEARARRRVALLIAKAKTGTCVFFIFFALSVGLMQLVLYVSPFNYYSGTVRSLSSVIIFNVSLISSALRSAVVWLDFASIADLAIEVSIALVSSALVVQWPQIPVKVPHLVKTRTGIRKGLETDFVQAADDGAIYADSIAAVLVCRESCCSESRRVSFSKRIQNLLTMFPPDSIFVVDSNPNAVCPVDATWQTAHEISPLIRYCFVPDCDSKIFALHWFNLVWLPFLVKSNQSQPFSHFLVLMASDDEGSLPAVPLEVTIPKDNLLLNEDNLRAVHYPLSAVSASSSSASCIVPCQDLDFKIKALSQLALSKTGTACEVQLAIGVWERQALVRALDRARTKDLCPLQQLESSLAVVKLRKRNHICSNPFGFVQTAVPGRVSDLVSYRIRNNHAGEIVRACTALIEIFSPTSLCSVNSWSIKPFLLMGTVVSGLSQMIRPFLILSLVFRDPLAIAALAGIAIVLILVLQIILFFVFSSRPDLKTKWSFLAICAYPLYRGFSCWFIELPALFDYIMGGSVKNKTLEPHKRFKDLYDAPACPPSPLVNWFTIWKADEDSLTDAETDFAKDDSVSSLGGFNSPRDARGA